MCGEGDDWMSVEERSYSSDMILDDLTGIYNRQGFYHYTRELLDAHPGVQFCMIYCNIRKFKVINDLFGRQAGDQVLIHLAKSFEERLGSGIATYGRMNSDKFVCCVQESLIKNEKWTEMGNVEFRIRDTDYRFFSCYGLYKIEDPKLDIASMVDKAHIAMETVKNNYVKPYAWFDSNMWDSMMEEQKLTSAFRKAIREHQFKVYYQPICSTSAGRIIGAEALVRWEKPGKGMISPGAFIPLFEKNGFISELDAYVLNDVCKMMKNRMNRGLESLPVSINVSRAEFYNPRLCENIYKTVERYGISPKYIRIEITESAYADNPEQVQEAVSRLHAYGFDVLMDDFGSGYSSFNVLKDLPIDVLKIDMRFMDDFAKNQKAAIILESIVRMAKWMQMRVVAEGVETQSEWDYLKSVECDLVQGYYFHKPMPEEEFLKLLDAIEENPKDTSLLQDPELDALVFDVFNHTNSRGGSLFYSMVGGMGIYEMTGDTLEAIQVNRGYYEVVYGTSCGLSEEMKVINKPIVDPDRSILIKACRIAKDKGNVQQVQLHHKREDGSFVWLGIKMRYLGNHGRNALFYFALDNIDDIKAAEQTRYMQTYSEALMKVFDKVYRLNYDTGMAEVVHSKAEDNMEEWEKYYFLDFFERFAAYIDWMGDDEAEAIVKDRAKLDRALEESENGNYSVTYNVCAKGIPVKQVTALFLRVEVEEGRQEYICCIKRKRA